MVVAAGVEPALAAFSTPCLCQIGLRDPGMKSGGTRRTCSPSRSERDVFTSDETRRAGPVHVPWCPRRDSHPHWPVFGAGASADWATRAKLTAGAPGRSRTGTGPGLKRPPLPNWATGAIMKSPGGRTRTRTGSGLSGVPLLIGLRRENLAAPDGLAPPTFRVKVGRSAD